MLAKISHHPSIALSPCIWLPLTIPLTLALPPRIKGASIGPRRELKIRG